MKEKDFTAARDKIFCTIKKRRNKCDNLCAYMGDPNANDALRMESTNSYRFILRPQGIIIEVSPEYYTSRYR